MSKLNQPSECCRFRILNVKLLHFVSRNKAIACFGVRVCLEFFWVSLNRKTHISFQTLYVWASYTQQLSTLKVPAPLFSILMGIFQSVADPCSTTVCFQLLLRRQIASTVSCCWPFSDIWGHSICCSVLSQIYEAVCHKTSMTYSRKRDPLLLGGWPTSWFHCLKRAKR